uniref:Carboxypeptidase regulatory-like domain-containing protein n=1 Tax=Desulfatirhabdium butyrativorans TaxID=340467 RepID=A0A7C4MQZ9_9BACT
MKKANRWRFLLGVLSLALLVVPMAQAAVIQGKVLKDNGQPVAARKTFVVVYQGSDACSASYITTVPVSSPDSNGINFTVRSLPPGSNYYLRTQSLDPYVDEWFTGTTTDAQASGSWDCADAKQYPAPNASNAIPAITLAEGARASGGFFELGVGAILANSRNDLWVTVYRDQGDDDPCRAKPFTQVNVPRGSGTFITDQLPFGKYYFQSGTNLNYADEWYDGGLGSIGCSGALGVALTAVGTTPNINFYLSKGGTIEGEVYKQGGGAIEPKSTYVMVRMENTDPEYPGACSSTIFTSVPVKDDGTYKTDNLPPGDYYLQTYTPYDSNRPNYLSEWYAPGASTIDCAAAQKIIISDGSKLTGYNFQLDPNAGKTISGKVYNRAGGEIDVQPELAIYINVFQYTADGPCHQGGWITSAVVGIDSTSHKFTSYTTPPLPAGDYLLQSYSTFGYMNEWYTEEGGTAGQGSYTCSGASKVTISNQDLENKHFYLDSDEE